MALGIDLGLSQCKVALFRDNKFEVIPNQHGRLHTPAYVAFAGGAQTLVGEQAKAQILSNSENTIFNLKRLIGKSFSDLVKEHHTLTGLPFKIESGPGDRPLIVITQDSEFKKLYAEEVMAILLRDLKCQAEAYLGRAIDKVVVTIPVYFNKH